MDYSSSLITTTNSNELPDIDMKINEGSGIKAGIYYCKCMTSSNQSVK